MNALARIVDGPIPPAPEADVAEIGARLRFEGIVRGEEDGATLAGLVYETYDPMAQQSLQALAEEALKRFEIEHIDVVHSRGLVPVGAVSLLVEVGSRHRVAGLAAMAWYIDQLKQVVPIWKHLRFPDGQTRPAPAAAAEPQRDTSKEA